MDKTNTCVVKGKGEEEREKTSCNARSSSYSFPKVRAGLQMLTPAISVATANPNVFHKSSIS